MLDQTYDYAAMVAQFEADELFASRFVSFFVRSENSWLQNGYSRLNNDLNSPNCNRSSASVSFSSSGRQPNTPAVEEVVRTPNTSLNLSSNSNVTIRSRRSKTSVKEDDKIEEKPVFRRRTIRRSVIIKNLNSFKTMLIYR